MTTMTDEEFEKALEVWLGSTGATRLQTFRVENDDMIDVEIWIAIARWADDDYRVTADKTRARAIATMCMEVGTDGICLACEKPTAFEVDPELEILIDPTRYCVTTLRDGEFLRACAVDH